ncbi:MAG: PEP-CTERM sorting domain-containing protein [Planctomycetota bacterium]
MKISMLSGVCAACLSLTVTSASAAFVDPGLAGNTQFDGWDNLTRTNPQVASTTTPFPFPDFPGAAPWPAPIESILTGGVQDTDPTNDDPTGDAYFDKTSGNGYPAGVSIYTSPFGNGGAFQVSDDTPVTDIETIIFQIELGGGSSGFLSGPPTLTINNGSTVVPLLAEQVIDSVFDPNGPFGPLTINTFGYQWDVRGLGPISDFDIDFDTFGSTSNTIFGLQLDQGSQFAQVIPEPASLLMIGLGSLAMFGRFRKS